MAASLFSDISTAAPDAILGITEAFRSDPEPSKVNLGVGVYQDAEGRIPMLRCIQEAARQWITTEDTKTYLPIDGVAAFKALRFVVEVKSATNRLELCNIEYVRW